MITEVLQVLYFFIPAYVANMTPVFVRKLPFANIPLDGGRSFRGRRLLGDNKTVRGLLAGVLLSTLVFVAQQALHQAGFVRFSLIEYPSYAFWLGAVIGFAALLGDLVESFAKRQMGIRPGARLLFWDQLDFFLVSLLATIPLWLAVWPAVLVSAALVFVLTVAVQRLGYVLRLKDDPL